MSAIYALASHGRVRYVGKTTRAPQRRLADHLRNARSGDRRQRRLWSWLRSLDGPPQLIVLERDPADINAAERHWIAAYRMIGAQLCNMTDGGDGQTPGYVPSAESRARAGAALRGRKRPPHVIEAVRAAHLGTTCSPETRAKISAKAKGRPAHNKRVWTDEMRARAVEVYARAPIHDAARELGISARALAVIMREEGVIRTRSDRIVRDVNSAIGGVQR